MINILLYQTLTSTIYENIYKKWYKNDKSKTSVLKWNEEFSDKSYSVSDIEDYFKYILKNYEAVTDNPLIRIYVDKIENRITFTLKTGYLDYLEPLTSETMKLIVIDWN